jgi:hypothetical protein
MIRFPERNLKLGELTGYFHRRSDQLESEVKSPELFPREEGQVEWEKLWVKDAEDALRLWASQVCDKDPSAEQFV